VRVGELTSEGKEIPGLAAIIFRSHQAFPARTRTKYKQLRPQRRRGRCFSLDRFLPDLGCFLSCGIRMIDPVRGRG
jgi:hypothetical protein